MVLDVEEFETDIHVCKKDYPDELQAGRSYVRPRGKPRTARVPSLTEMRELHNLAIDKGVREFVRRAGAAGLPLASVHAAEDVELAAFRSEYETAWANPTSVDTQARALVEGILVPAYTDVPIRPGPDKADRLRPDQLLDFISEHAVRLRGWPLPMINGRDPIQRHGAWVGQDLQAEIGLFPVQRG